MNNRLDKVCVSFFELKGSKWISNVNFFPNLNTKVWESALADT